MPLPFTRISSSNGQQLWHDEAKELIVTGILRLLNHIYK